ncbi:NAD(P)H-hydrate epimerase [Luteibacter rhizovicinus]|uniref:Bifunctional NAD(P)H-hydrate repair enzyme n=1 Tax=Luteibacter rhizovicinus TaxID=242606 RepID=A0A4R3YHU0_9GAMM|nr:NAD(P)H-hydrate dehydratase [Luteibacter rhizovicinus]TCV91786.1 NAD(P)H-hydrate epimerase [Luteibacter rhizovicinus]
MSSNTVDTALFTAGQARELDRRASQDLGIPGFELMRRAAHAAFDTLGRRWPQASRVVVLCGSGNNGGDGYLVAELALQAGMVAEVVALDAPGGGDALTARQNYESHGGIVHNACADMELPDADVYVDALYGTGLNRAPAGIAASLIERLNACGKPILALDIPSGLSADSGTNPGAAVQATVTVTFIVRKRGLSTGRCGLAGDIELARLGLPDELVGTIEPDAHLLSPQALPARPRDSHKGDNGHVLAIGGDHGTGGAIRMASEAALRTGAGLVSVATRDENVFAINTGRPELMARGVNGPQALEPLLDKATVLALGPGLGQGAWGHALWTTALDAGRPLVLDADGLNMLAKEKRDLPVESVITPHPGEAGRLLGVSTADIQRDRYAAARELARRYGAVAVLKGNGSLIASPDGRVAVCPWGNPGMAGGGMGDTLTGIVAALMAQGLSAWDAACLGVGLHARAADVAARDGERGLLATDLLDPLRRLVNGLKA